VPADEEKNTEHNLSRVMDHARQLLEVSTTGVIFTPNQTSMGFGDQRSSLVMVSPASEKTKGWFRFNTNVDFHTCMPADQQPKLRP